MLLLTTGAHRINSLFVVETASLNETELAEYAHKKGLYVEQIKAWKDACMNANRGIAKEAARLNRELKDSQKERKKLEKELQRKLRPCSCCQKKSKCDLGGSRGRSISAADRSAAIQLIDEAVNNGARLSKACERLGITERTYYRWKSLNKEHHSYEDRRAYADHSDPVNKLTPEERQKVINTDNEERFASMSPCEIVPALADEGEYIASESTFYRILREEKMKNHRGRSQEPGKHGKPTAYVATAPNQVWTWDITYLRAR